MPVSDTCSAVTTTFCVRRLRRFLRRRVLPVCPALAFLPPSRRVSTGDWGWGSLATAAAFGVGFLARFDRRVSTALEGAGDLLGL